jgi:hypothetical protein
MSLDFESDLKTLITYYYLKRIRNDDDGDYMACPQCESESEPTPQFIDA